MTNPIRQFSISALLALCFSMLLTGCSETIDVRQLETTNGLVYKLHEHEPFTGTVINYRQIGTLTNCTVNFKNGELHGPYVCLNSQGFTVIDVTYKNNQKHGVEKLWNDRYGYLISKTEWKGGLRHGVEEKYNPDEVLIEQIHWHEGEKAGEEKAWDIEGKILLRHFSWVDGEKTGFCKCTNLEENYVDGKLHGIQRYFGFQLYKSREDFDNKYYAWKKLNENGQFWYPLAQNIYLRTESVYEHGEHISTKEFEDPSNPNSDPNKFPPHGDYLDGPDY